ncbi:biotin--[acetyl-CoA-carboxylase] ligase [Terracidiphilus gabretensis]|uniref:biotin--[acetyl-CoA-carboxylase] ligase n=1 Tax=Terracidiphilus gabretensis TaxID=1577687 RepID=UPI00071BE3A5|nr:biotin--[acetyl-CoA-carboxylase] ligase [Terracidiphilus gabretensis]
MYDLPALDASLAASIYAGKLHYAPVTGSTNTDALAAARSGAPHGSVYFADEQTAGRGRGDHAWLSVAAQGIYVSVLFRLALPVERLPLLPLAAGLAAAEAIRAVSGLAVDLRWPNDLLLDERKTGGILAEAQTENTPGAATLSYAVIGIGINVHQSRFQPGLATPATSLDLESGRYISRQELLVALLESLEREALALLDSAGAATIPSRVEQASTWVRGRRVEVHGPQACVGMTEGLDGNGFLLVRGENGLVRVQTGGIRSA